MTRTPILGVNLKEMKPYVHTNTYTQMFIAVLFNMEYFKKWENMSNRWMQK